VTEIRERDEYGGRRVVVSCNVGAARVNVQIDIGIGDIVTPAAEWIDYPSLLGFPAARLRGYPRETVVAEKLHAIVVLGLGNSRMKDYFDILALLRENEIDPDSLARAVAATFERRRTAVPRDIPSGLSDGFAGDPPKQSQWAAFLKKNRLEAPPLEAVVDELRTTLMGVLVKARRAKGSE
jgi:hypothetical protein